MKVGVRNESNSEGKYNQLIDQEMDETNFEGSSVSSDYIDDVTLFEPAREGSFERVKQLLEKMKRDTLNFAHERDKLNAQGYSALHLAARYNRVKIVKLLLEEGAPIDAPDDDDCNTPLLLAAKYEMTDAAFALLQASPAADPCLANKYGTTPLHFAARRCNLALCQALLDIKKVQVNAKDHKGTLTTPLHMAVIGGDSDVVKLLIDRGGDVEAKDKEEEMPIHYAAAEDAGDLIKLLLDGALRNIPAADHEKKQKKFINAQSRESDTALHVAAQAGYLETVKTLVSLGANVNIRTDTRQTPLHLAAVGGQSDVAAFLILSGAKINAVDDDFMTPLHRACLYGRYNTVEFLLNRGAKINSRDKDNFTPLMCAIWKGQDDVAVFLLSKGADIRALESNNKNVLHLAIDDNHIKTLKMLINNGGDVLINEVDKDYKAPLHYAAESGDEEAVELLLKHKCEVDIGDSQEKTPLHLAAEMGSLECVLLLANSGRCPINATDENGNSPLHLAAAEGHKFVVAELIEMGAESSCRNDVDWTPLDYAARNGHMKAMRVLLENDAPVDATDANLITPLHHCAMNGHVSCINLLLDSNASINKRDKYGKNCLDVAIDNLEVESCHALVKHKRWKETFSNFPTNVENFVHPMSRLIESVPDIALIVLDQCISYENGKKSADYTITGNVALLDPPDDVSEICQPYFGPAVMVKHKREDLLSHPLTVMCIRDKFGRLGRWLYLASLLTYLLFVSLLTALIVVEKDDDRIRRFNTTLSKTIDACATGGGSFSTVVPWLTLGLAAFQVLKEIFQLIYSGSRYIYEWENLFELCLYLATVLFMLPFIMCQLGTNPNNQDIIDLKWTAGSVSILFAWFNLLLYLKRFPYFGLYVVMFVEVFKTLINVLVVFSILIIAFALSFYAVLSKQDAFKMPGRSIVRTTVMMIGELEYHDTFVSQYETRKLLPYKEMSLFVFVMFLILMTIVVMNLLVGLAVGDIEAIRKTAYLRTLKLQVHMINTLDSSYFHKLLDYLFPRENNRIIHSYPNRKNLLSRISRWFGRLDYESLKSEQSESSGKEDLMMEEILNQKDELEKQKERMKLLSTMLEEQGALMTKIAQALKVSDKAAEM